ncbi:MAG TPA: hypothetical protein VIH72_00910 [Candidatus Acidoferrales bacterium]|jgi:hypothetical protein
MAKKQAAAPPKIVPITIDEQGNGPANPTKAIFGDFIRFDNIGDTDRAILYALDGSNATQFDPLCVIVPSYSSVTVLATTANNPAPNSTATVYFKIRTKVRGGAAVRAPDDTYQVIVGSSRKSKLRK